MRTAEERIEQLHRRANVLQKQRNRRQIAGFGGASAFFAVLLTAAMVQTGTLANTITGNDFTGSSLLGESTGGYVLAAVIAFFVGVILTAAIFRRRRM